MIKELIKPEHQLFHHRINSCSYNLDRYNLSELLKENMIHYNGVGLSANQIGIWERAFCMMVDIKTEEIITCFNPRIVKTYGESTWFEEGCLSFPDQTINVCRPTKIVVKYEDEDKKLHKKKLDGFISRIFQHEHDHMEGVDFTQR
tara:strand:+ start:324 stop:761 length:438 start_codon:yes stop_codon:yes gene_type:complete